MSLVHGQVRLLPQILSLGIHILFISTVQHRFPWSIPAAHREALACHARSLFRFFLLLELRLRSCGSCPQDGPSIDWKAKYYRYARSEIPLSDPPPSDTQTVFLAGAYHGRTFGAMGVTRSKTIYSEGFAPLMVSHTTRLRGSYSSETSIYKAWRFHHAVPVLAPTLAASFYERGGARHALFVPA